MSLCVASVVQGGPVRSLTLLATGFGEGAMRALIRWRALGVWFCFFGGDVGDTPWLTNELPLRPRPRHAGCMVAPSMQSVQVFLRVPEEGYPVAMASGREGQAARFLSVTPPTVTDSALSATAAGSPPAARRATF